MDSKGPFVGAYPFRKSLSNDNNNHVNDTQTNALAAVHRDNHVNKALLRDYSKFNTPLFGNTATSSDVLAARIRNHYAQSTFTNNAANCIVVGSHVGGLLFSLGQELNASNLIGIDFNADYVHTANKLLLNDSSHPVIMNIPVEGEVVTQQDVVIRKDTSKNIQFKHSDPMCLPAELAGFDVVVLDDVIDTLASPNALLGRCGGIRGLVKSNGLLFILSAYQWNPNITPKSLWLGGFMDKNENSIPVKSLSTLKSKLTADSQFEFVANECFPRVHVDKANAISGKLLELSVWKRL